MVRGKDLLPASLYCSRSGVDYRLPTPLWGAGDFSLVARVPLSVQLIDLRSRTPLIKAAGSLDLQVTPSHTRTLSPTLRLGLPS